MQRRKDDFRGIEVDNLGGTRMELRGKMRKKIRNIKDEKK